MTQIKSFKLFVVLLLVAWMVAGCGGSDNGAAADKESTADTASTTDSARTGSSTTRASSSAKSEFIRRANEICARNSKDFLTPLGEYLEQHASSGKTEAEVAADAVRKAILPMFQTQIDQIGELSVPPDDDQQIEAFLNAMQQAVDSLAQQQQVTLPTELDAAFRRAGKLGHAYGLESCL